MTTYAVWRERLRELCVRIQRAARDRLQQAVDSGDMASIDRPIREGAGDVTFGIDEPTEQVLDEWLLEVAANEPISLLTEDSGWRHRGPGPAGPRELDGFGHGGPRVVVDPIDGTRVLMADLRSAWTVLGFAAPGDEPPRMSDVSAGLVVEIPTTRAARYRLLEAERGGPCRLELWRFEGAAPDASRTLQTDASDRVDFGHFPFFRYHPRQRPRSAELEARFFARLEEYESADLRNCYDDQYTSSGGQLVLLALGTYRMVCDPRGALWQAGSGPRITAKPYDVSGAILCAEAAGCVVRAVDGAELEFPLDVTTPVSFVGYVNAATAARLEPHLRAALDTL